MYIIVKYQSKEKVATVSIDTHIIFLYCLFLSDKGTYVIVGGRYQLALSIVETIKNSANPRPHGAKTGLTRTDPIAVRLTQT
jgi:hypothetical protein